MSVLKRTTKRGVEASVSILKETEHRGKKKWLTIAIKQAKDTEPYEIYVPTKMATLFALDIIKKSFEAGLTLNMEE